MPVKIYNPKRYSCNGSQKIFPFDFGITKESDIVAILIDPSGNETTLNITTHYSVSKAGDNWDSGGNVETVQTYGSGYTLVIKRVMTIDQQTDYVYNDNFDDEAHEDVVDKLTMIAQQLHEELNRTLKLLMGSAYTGLTIPDPVADYLLAWRADKTGLKNVTGANIGDLIVSDWIKNNLLDDADAAAACTTLGAFDKNNDIWKDVPGGPYDLIVSSQADLALLITGDSTQYNSVFIKHGAYTMSIPLDFQSHGVKYLRGERPDTKITFDNYMLNPFVKLNDEGIVENLTIEVSVAGTPAKILRPNNVSTNSSYLKNVRAICSGDAIGVHDGFDSIKGGMVNCYAEKCNDGFTSCDHLVNCKSYDNSEDGFYGCDYIANCESESNTMNGFESCGDMHGCKSQSNTLDGYKTCVGVTSSYATLNGQHGFNDVDHISSCSSSVNTHSGFNECDIISSCYSHNNSDHGFLSCNRVSACQSKDDVHEGFRECNQISACYVYDNGGSGFMTCQDMSSCRAFSCSGDGHVSCSMMAACASESNTGYGFNNCSFMSSCYANGNTTGDWNACAVEVDADSCNNT